MDHVEWSPSTDDDVPDTLDTRRSARQPHEAPMIELESIVREIDVDEQLGHRLEWQHDTRLASV